MKNNSKIQIIVAFIFLVVFLLFQACVSIPAVRDLIATATATATPYANFPQYDSNETPFYNPLGDSTFVPVINFKGMITWRQSWMKDPTHSPILIEGDRLLFAGHMQEPDKSQYNFFRELNSELICIDINSGQVLWQDWIGMPDLLMDESHILYVPSTRDFVPPGLVAYDIFSGKKLWETRFPHKYGDIDTFYQLSQELFVTVSLGHEEFSSYVVDGMTGTIKQQFEGERYSGYKVVISNGIALHHTDLGYGPVNAFQLDKGEQIWDFSEPVISNIAVDGLTVYFVTVSTQLIAVDIQSGKILGILAFTPEFDPNFDYNDPNYDSPFDFLNDPPTVTADNGYVAVYFEDKRQLSVFRFVSGQ